MRYALVFAFLAIVALFVQTALLPWFLPQRTSVDLLLVFAVHLALRHPSVGGTAAAFCLGYLQDAVSGTLAGLNAASMLAVYLVVYRSSRHLWIDNVVSQVVVVFLAGWVKIGVSLLALAWFQGQEDWLRLAHTFLLSTCLTALVAPFVFRVLRLAHELLVNEEE